MPDSERGKRRFGELQLALLRALWDRGEATVKELLEAVRPERSPAYTTVATVLSRLEEQGIVSHRKEGRQHVYTALVAESEVQRSIVDDVVEKAFGGDAGRLLTHLVRRSEVEGADLDALRALIEERKD